MTFKEFMKEVGYDPMTTFWEDFSIADKYGIAGVKDTYKRAFSEWKDDYKFFTELTLVLNHKIWQHYESNRKLAALYENLNRLFPLLIVRQFPFRVNPPCLKTKELNFSGDLNLGGRLANFLKKRL